MDGVRDGSRPHPYHHYPDTTGGVFPVSTFSAFHLLRNYNYLLAPHAPTDISKLPIHQSQHRLALADPPLQSPKADHISPLSIEIGKSFLPQHSLISQNLLGYRHHHLPLPRPASPRNGELSPDNSFLSQSLKRQRGEKKPIPDEQKDEKYFERRRRNNQAAKKSRDARKIREDQVALRATILEHENAILKAQILTLREEASSLRQMLLQKKALELTS